MNITEIRITLLNEPKLKGKATVTFDNCFVVQDLKVLLDSGVYSISMPKFRLLDGTHGDIAHPCNLETHRKIEDAVLKAFITHVKTSSPDLSDTTNPTHQMSMGGD